MGRSTVGGNLEMCLYVFDMHASQCDSIISNSLPYPGSYGVMGVNIGMRWVISEESSHIATCHNIKWLLPWQCFLNNIVIDILFKQVSGK